VFGPPNTHNLAFTAATLAPAIFAITPVEIKAGTGESPRCVSESCAADSPADRCMPG